MRQLRRKLGDASPIVTVWGVGYKVARRASATTPAQRRRRAPCSRSLRFRDSGLLSRSASCWSGVVAAADRGPAVPELRPGPHARRAAARSARPREAVREAGDRRVDAGRAGSVRRAETSSRRRGYRIYYVGGEIFPAQAVRAAAAARRRLLDDWRLEQSSYASSSRRRGQGDVLRGRVPVHARPPAVRRARRREAEGRSCAARWVASCERLGDRFLVGVGRRGRARLVPLAADDEARARALARGRRGRRRPLRRGSCRRARRRTRSAHLTERFAEMARRSTRRSGASATS